MRTAAQAEADKLYPQLTELEIPAICKSRRLRQKAFIKGAVWGAALVTPTREQIALVLCGMKFSEEPCRSELDCEESIGSHALEIADAVLALLQGQGTSRVASIRDA